MKPIDILLVYPKTTTDSPTVLTPLSILFPGALFKRMGLRIAYFDERFDSHEMLVDLIKHSKEIGVSAFTGYQSKRAAEILELAKRINPFIITGVGGHHARLLSEQVLSEPFVDLVWSKRIYGEEFFPYDKDTKIFFERGDVQYFTSRGCPFNCSFCALHSKWEPKDISKLDKELKIIHNDVKFKTITFSDPNIACGYRVNRIKQIGSIMKDLDVVWNGNMRAEYLNPEMIDALVKSNCKLLEIGCESGNDYFLKNVIKKGTGIDIVKKAVKNIKGSGISLMYSFMAFMPRETIKMLLDTLDFIDWIIENDPNARVSIFNYAPYPGTPMYEDAINGVEGYPKFIPPTTMKDWGSLSLMRSPIYWIAGLSFRKDNTKKNFPGEDWKIIEPYVKLAEEKWKKRDIDDFPCEEVETLISKQLEKKC